MCFIMKTMARISKTVISFAFYYVLIYGCCFNYFLQYYRRCLLSYFLETQKYLIYKIFG